MTDLPAYATGLAIACLASFFFAWKRGDARLSRVAGIILINWCVGLAFKTYTGNEDAWEFNIFEDVVSAWAIMHRPAHRWQATIGILYGCQIAAHIGYGALEWFGLQHNKWVYYDLITVIAWAQLLALGGMCGGMGKIALHPRRLWAAALDRRSRARHNGTTR